MKLTSRGRSSEQRRTLAIRGVEGVGVTETAEQLSLALDVSAMDEETQVAADDFLLTYNDDFEAHTKVPVASFLNFPPRGCVCLTYQVNELIPSKSLYRWTKRTGVQFVMGIAIGGGGGGSGGAQGLLSAAQNSGTGGGGGGYIRTPLIPASMWDTGGSVRVGNGGGGGAGALGANVAGTAGSAGRSSQISGLLGGVEIVANGGGGGSAVTVNTGNNISGGTGAASTGEGGAETLGAGGNGGGSNDTVSPPLPGNALRGAAGGGGAGGRTANALVQQLSQDGGRANGTNLPPAARASVVGNGFDSDIGQDAPSLWPLLNGAGGGGGGVYNISAGFIGGPGGDGGFPGGGGGGGGASINGVGYAGGGGNGAPGAVGVFQFF